MIVLLLIPTVLAQIPADLFKNHPNEACRAIVPQNVQNIGTLGLDCKFDNVPTINSTNSAEIQQVCERIQDPSRLIPESITNPNNCGSNHFNGVYQQCVTQLNPAKESCQRAFEEASKQPIGNPQPHIQETNEKINQFNTCVTTLCANQMKALGGDSSIISQFTSADCASANNCVTHVYAATGNAALASPLKDTTRKCSFEMSGCVESLTDNNLPRGTSTSDGGGLMGVLDNPALKATTMALTLSSLFKPKEKPKNDAHTKQRLAQLETERAQQQEEIDRLKQQVAYQQHSTGTWSPPTNTITDETTGAQQNLNSLTQNDTIEMVPNSTIYVISNNNVMFGLKGIGNTGVRQTRDGYSLAEWGTTTVAVAREGGVTLVGPAGHVIGLLPGSYVYSGTGTQTKDTFTTNGGMFEHQSKVHVEACGENYPEVKRHSMSVTFNHQQLSLSANAVDITKTSRAYQLLATGCEDVYLATKPNLFPLHIRTTAKGSNHVIYWQNILLDNEYNLEDGLGYKYIIKGEGVSTKVYTLDGMIVQDSAPPQLPNKQIERFLIYEMRA